MTLEEKIDFCTGSDFWHTKVMHGVPAIKMSDGPHGLRCQPDEADMLGINDSVPATCFPPAVTAGATWNRRLYAKEGEAIGKEALFNGVSVVLGPGCNIKRGPLGGRSFEYLSEDPFVAGKMAAAFIQGQQSTGAKSCIKHYAVNSQEYKRQNGDSMIDDRTYHEIYLTPFEYAVKEGKVGTVMCSYNKINGIHASDNKELLTDILRTDWGFEGLVMTDWGAMHDKREAFKAGCDLSMPGGFKYMDDAVLEAVKNGSLSEEHIDTCVRRILELVESSVTSGDEPDMDAHHALSLEVAKEGAVLLKNDDNILPLKKEQMVLIGSMANSTRYQGAGSSHINPTKLVNITDALPNVKYVPCCDAEGYVTFEELKAAAEAAKLAEVAVVVAGLPDSYESEGFDRAHMGMPKGYNRMVETVADANPNTVVVLLGGSPMETPWADKVKAILYMGLPGQAAGQAVAELLTGEVSPSGKLTETWAISYDDIISKDTFGQKNTEYREGIYMGYRYFDKAGKPVRFPFGHGLSYTTFEYSDLELDGKTVSVKITNTGAFPASEVVQLYIAPPKGGIHRPVKELRGFEKLFLTPGETKTAKFTLDDRSFAVWCGGWKVPAGTYTIMIGASSADIRLCADMEIEGETVSNDASAWYDTLEGSPTREDWESLMGYAVPIPEEPARGTFGMDSTPLEMSKKSLVMKIFCKFTEKKVMEMMNIKDRSDPMFKMMCTMALDGPIRATVISAGDKMSENMARGLVDMANGKYICGLKKLLKK
ncbi:MAG: glycoside hydrolase family 3 C-terminal domain-containing protein [Oscillospiraceae bacterium]|nr:glycoside hydrolase family 3 C-terminal domain-containing protein [Oscillospiraceae bacterium]